MKALRTKINTKAPSYIENKKLMNELVKELEAKYEEGLFQGSEKSIAKARKREKYLARERINLLLDQDSPFLELLPLAGLKKKGGFGAGGTNVAGIGLVQGKLVMVNSNVGTRKGGAFDQSTLYKILRVAQITRECELPTINLVESGGANLPDQDTVFNYGGKMFREITRRSELGIPTISVVFGNATAGGAYVPGMSDYAIFQKKAAKVFLAGPPLVKMATNEISTDEELGGAEMHSKVSGVADYLAEDELDAIRMAREIMEFIPKKKPFLVPEKVTPPLYDANEILGVVPANVKTPFDIRELIMRITDGSQFSEFKPLYGETLVCGWANIHGYPVGIIGNNGVIFSESANKGAQFIQLSNQKNIPLIFLQNTTGFMVGKKYEEGGIIKNGAKLINAVTNSKVPSITIIIGSSYGAGNYGMNGRSYDPNFLFTYPNSKIAVMGSEQLAGVMDIVNRAAAKSRGEVIDEDQAEFMKQMLIKQADEKASAWYASSETWDDGIIKPQETRNYLGFALTVLYDNEIKGATSYGIWRH
jgi:acetyl-CoA carboxylase carboxyltransferase component